MPSWLNCLFFNYENLSLILSTYFIKEEKEQARCGGVNLGVPMIIYSPSLGEIEIRGSLESPGLGDLLYSRFKERSYLKK